MMKNIKDFFKRNYKLIIPVSLIFVLFIAALVYYKVTVLNHYTKETKDKFYQYFYGKRYEYTATVSTNRKDVIVNFETTDYDIKYDSTPIYYQNKDKVIFPSDMSVVMPTLNCSEYLSLKYSYLTVKKGNYILTTDKYSNKLGNYFLYDGLDLYFFIDSVKLITNSEEISLSPLSYVVASDDGLIRYYDKESDTYRTIENVNNQTVVENDYYKVYVNLDNIDYYGTDVILTSEIGKLNTINLKEK